MSPKLPAGPNDVVRGTLELLILKAVSLEPMHGWAISQRLEQLSRDAFGSDRVRRALGEEAKTWRGYVDMVELILQTR